MLRLRFHRFRPIITSSQLAKGEVTRDNTWISAPSGGSVNRDRRTIRNGTVNYNVVIYVVDCHSVEITQITLINHTVTVHLSHSWMGALKAFVYHCCYPLTTPHIGLTSYLSNLRCSRLLWCYINTCLVFFFSTLEILIRNLIDFTQQMPIPYA